MVFGVVVIISTEIGIGWIETVKYIHMMSVFLKKINIKINNGYTK
jgi:hypothetical protein